MSRLVDNADYYAEVAGIPIPALLQPCTDFGIEVEEMETMVIAARKSPRAIWFQPEDEPFIRMAARVGCFNRNEIDARMFTVNELAQRAIDGKGLECEVVVLHSCHQQGLSERDYGMFLSMLEEAQKRGISVMVRMGTMPSHPGLKKRLGELLA